MIHVIGYLLVDWQMTPASSLWTQLCTPKPLSGQSTSRSSVPPQFTLSSQMVPVPWPKAAFVRATAPVDWRNFMIIEAQPWTDSTIYTWGGESQLSAHNHCINRPPAVITDSAPFIIVAYLNTSLQIVGTIDQANVSFSTHCQIKVQMIISCLHKQYMIFMLTHSTGSTSHTSILRMYTIVTSNGISRAINQPWFCSNTLDIIKPDGTSPSTKSSKWSTTGTYWKVR